MNEEYPIRVKGTDTMIIDQTKLKSGMCYTFLWKDEHFCIELVNNKIVISIAEDDRSE